MRSALLAILGLAIFAGSAEAQRRGRIDQDRYDSEYKAIQEKLRSRRISLDFQDAPMNDVISFMRQVLGVNLLVDPGVYQDTPADELKVSMTVKDLRADNALDLLLQMNNLIKTYRNGVLLITTKERHTEDTYLVVYDVRDMMFTIKDFKGPNISLTSAGTGSGTAGVTFDTGDDTENELSNPDTLLELIKSNAASESWENNEECTASMINGLLVVNQTRSGHYEVGRLLNMLRAFR